VPHPCGLQGAVFDLGFFMGSSRRVALDESESVVKRYLIAAVRYGTTWISERIEPHARARRETVVASLVSSFRALTSSFFGRPAKCSSRMAAARRTVVVFLNLFCTVTSCQYTLLDSSQNQNARPYPTTVLDRNGVLPNLQTFQRATFQRVSDLSPFPSST
jgi:hypothetical protein